MLTIHKFIFTPGQDKEIDLPSDCKPLHVAAQGSSVCLWVELDADDRELMPHWFRTIGTGKPIDHGNGEDEHTYWGTAHTTPGQFVYHLYEISSPAHRQHQRDRYVSYKPPHIQLLAKRFPLHSLLDLGGPEPYYILDYCNEGHLFVSPIDPSKDYDGAWSFRGHIDPDTLEEATHKPKESLN